MTTRDAIKALAERMPPTRVAVDALRVWRHHQRQSGRRPRLIRPRTLNDRLARKKIIDRRAYLVRTADKLAVRDYVASLLGTDALTELYAVAHAAEEIDFGSLPRSFVMKPTHGSGMVRVVEDLTREDPDELRALASRWLATRYGVEKGEWWYSRIRPRVIFEERLRAEDGGVPADYKIFVFDGEPQVVQVDVNRFGDHRRNLYDREWRLLPIERSFPQADEPLPRPESLGTLLRYAAALGQETDFVRVDLYDANGRVVFGELTHCPASGAGEFRIIAGADHPNFENPFG